MKEYIHRRLMRTWSGPNVTASRQSTQSSTPDDIVKNIKPSTSYWLSKNKYYHDQVAATYRFLIPPGQRVLHVNCDSGNLLEALEPAFGVGVSADQNSTKKTTANGFSELHTNSLSSLPSETFDYIILSFVTEQTDDVQGLLEELHRFCTPRTRIFVDTYSYLWEPILWLTSKLGLRRPTQFKHWISTADMANFFHLTQYEPITTGSYMLLPFPIPGLAWIANKLLAWLPLVNALCLHRWTLVRPNPALFKTSQKPKVSVIVTCRNERGNIQAVIDRMPALGSSTEILFVEGGSSDGTREEIERLIALHPERSMRLIVQDGVGKGDAVRKGFAHASGDILMIFDGDMTTTPEELPRFFDALVSGKGDFINGSRLVYGIQSDAMRPLHVFANFFFGRLLSWILGQRIKDSLCGTKVLWKKDYDLIAARRSFFGEDDPFGDFDLLFGAAKLHLKIVDMPVTYWPRTYGSPNIRHVWCGLVLLQMSARALKKMKLRW